MFIDMFAPRVRSTSAKVLLLFSLLLHSAVSQDLLPNVSSTYPDSRSRTWCPERCDVSGPSPSNWSVYANINRFSTCPQSIYYGFALTDNVDDPDAAQRVYACASSNDAGWVSSAQDASGAAPKPASSSGDAKYQIGSWSGVSGSPVASASKTVISQLRAYLDKGLAPVKGPTVVITSLGSINFGLYIGEGLQNQVIGSFALKALESSLSGNLAGAARVAMQYCHANQTADHIFGFIASGDGKFGPIQAALQSWANATCLSIPSASDVTGPAVFNTPLYDAANSTLSSNSTSGVTNSTLSQNLTSSITNSSRFQNVTLSSRFARLRRADCSTKQVVSGDSCGSLAQKCGISGNDFMKYNPGDGFCSKLQVGQHVCCSAGTLPDFAPKPNSDGSCAAYTVVENDNCAVIANKFSLTNDKLESFNLKTWGWNGCATLWLGTVMCVSTGDPPMPAAVKNAQCGPQKPGTSKPPSGTDLSTLNPCPLNACCNIWGQCGVTAPYCTISKSATGAPGTAKKGENGCISNCGTKIVRSAAPASQMQVAFYEGYNLGRECLYQSAAQVDTASNTHVFFSFGTFDASWKISVGDEYGQFEFEQFKRLPRVKKVLSIGGWDFSTFPAYYQFFRNAVLPANRQAFANSVAAFVKQHNLDGVNIDWEYPGAPDMPGIPAADPNEGFHYLAMLKLLRAALPDKEISVCAPASYWYLQHFPIKQIGEISDYVIYMTYDLHGQWDANNQWAQSGCPSGYCLQSQINITETLGALSMITKAGVPSNKIIPGVTSYGRSFRMSQAGCYGPQCTYTGSATSSNAKAGVCTKTGGYIANAEIFEIINGRKRDGRVSQNFYDSASASNILVYDDVEWVAWMDDNTKNTRKQIFKAQNMLGAAEWASDLQLYNPAPGRSTSWESYKKAIKEGSDPNQVTPPTGDWNNIRCDNPAIANLRDYTSDQRWSALRCSDAWDYAVQTWKKVDKPAGSFSFSQSISLTLHGPQQTNCGLTDGTCDSYRVCSDFEGIGAGAYEVWNSLVFLNRLYSRYRGALVSASATILSNAMNTFESTFAPLPPPDPTQAEIDMLIALITLGTTAAFAPFFNSIAKVLPYLKSNPNTLGVIKDDTNGLIAFGASAARANIKASPPAEWTLNKQNGFTKTLGESLHGWAAANDIALKNLFSGDDASIEQLGTMIRDGHLIAGKGGFAPSIDVTQQTTAEVEESITRAFWSFAIPAVWDTASYSPFVIDSGTPCGDGDKMGEFLDDSTTKATSTCVDGSLYYVAYPKGDATTYLENGDDIKNKFTALPGIGALDGQDWGKITPQDIVTGSVRTWKQNGNKNGGAISDATNRNTVTDLINQDITTPGYIRLPVCKPDYAFKAWDNPTRADKKDPNWPCVYTKARAECYDITFEDQTSDASPSVSDCQGIIHNIEGTDGRWDTGIGPQKRLVLYGNCAVGVQNDGVKGSVDYFTGAQDLVDIIQGSIDRYGGSGKIGAKGTMTCQGNASKQPVKWGLYYK